MPDTYLFCYAAALSLLAFVLMGWDKRQARRRCWRIPEAVLLTAAALGGAPGACLAMTLFRHKTRKPVFRYGLPLLLAAQIGIAVMAL